MLDQMVLWERGLFLALNSPHTPYLDAFFHLISARWTWTAVIVAFIAWLFYKRPAKEALFFIGIVALMIAFTDQETSSLIKPLCARLRPTHHPYTKDLVLNAYGNLGGGFGFVSGHAANFMAIALFTALVFRDRWYSIIVFSLAVIVAYSRIYLGMHFITDVVPGSLIGLLNGWIFFLLYRRVRAKWMPRPHPLAPHEAFRATLPIWRGILAGYLFFLLFFAQEVVKILQQTHYY
nr:phosphatase PAP2 family protein [uncultured Porphyromonas sp.]